MKKVFLFVALVSTCLVTGCGDDNHPQDLRCMNITCSDHGTCVITDDRPTCVCDNGYHNENDTSCIPDFGTCEGAADGTPCDDGNPCTQGTCQGGVCVSGATNKDSDGDGYYDASCAGGNDCNDADGSINPGVPEGPEGDARCSDGKDNDCNGFLDGNDIGCQSRICSSDGWCWYNPLPQGNWLEGVWSSGPNNVWAVGGYGTILHWNGTSWSSVSSGTTNTLWGIFGTSANDIWAVGDFGTILHWNGTSWSSVSSGTANWLYGIFGTSANDIWAVGEGGTILRRMR